MNETVLLEIRDGVAVVTLNQPESANALGTAMGRDLLEAALRVEGDPAARAVVVTGAGRHFCFGGDLNGIAAQGDAVGGYLNELTTHIHSAITCFTRMRAPVIAAVNGTAAGGPVPSPDGRHIALRKIIDSPGLNWGLEPGMRNSEVFVIAIDGSSSINVSSNGAFDGWPMWSPSGRWLVFSSNRDKVANTGQIYAAAPTEKICAG